MQHFKWLKTVTVNIHFEKKIVEESYKYDLCDIFCIHIQGIFRFGHQERFIHPIDL